MNRIHFYENNWPRKSAELIQSAVDDTLIKKNSCNIILTGGETACKLYRAWSKLKSFKKLTNVNFYFSDERIVPYTSVNSNYYLVKKNLFYEKKVLRNNNIYRIETEKKEILNNYNKQLPKNIDILLLTIGDDGHIASLFPKTKALYEKKKNLIFTNSSSHPFKRISITSKVIRSAKDVYVLAPGKIKKKVFDLASLKKSSYFRFPAKIVLNRNWVLSNLL